MKMNMYMEISLILFLIVGFSTLYAIYKGTDKLTFKVLMGACISGVSIMLIWRAVNLFSYFN